jgi:hypothetical protein
MPDECLLRPRPVSPLGLDTPPLLPRVVAPLQRFTLGSDRLPLLLVPHAALHCLARADDFATRFLATRREADGDLLAAHQTLRALRRTVDLVSAAVLDDLPLALAALRFGYAVVGEVAGDDTLADITKQPAALLLAARVAFGLHAAQEQRHEHAVGLVGAVFYLVPKVKVIGRDDRRKLQLLCALCRQLSSCCAFGDAFYPDKITMCFVGSMLRAKKGARQPPGARRAASQGSPAASGQPHYTAHASSTAGATTDIADTAR